MTYRVIQMIGGKMTKREYDDATQLYRRMTIQGRKHTGFSSNPRQREELQNQPIFEGYHGPMWDGDAIRYEDAKSYAALSV